MTPADNVLIVGSWKRDCPNLARAASPKSRALKFVQMTPDQYPDY